SARLDGKALVARAIAARGRAGRVPGALDEADHAVRAGLDQGRCTGAIATEAAIIAVRRDEGARQVAFAGNADAGIRQEVFGRDVAVEQGLEQPGCPHGRARLARITAQALDE